jgi:hypothetical protein
MSRVPTRRQRVFDGLDLPAVVRFQMLRRQRRMIRFGSDVENLT